MIVDTLLTCTAANMRGTRINCTIAHMQYAPRATCPVALPLKNY